MKTIFAISLLFALSSLLSAQVDSVCGQRAIPINVLDDQGRQPANLTSKQFHVDIGGHTLKVLSATLESGHRRVLILLNRVGSPGDWALAKLLAEDVVSSDSSNTDFALATFINTVRLEVGFEGGLDDLRRGIADLDHKLPKGASRPAHEHIEYRRTATHDALLEAIKIFGTPQPGDAIYVITGGNYYHYSNAALEPDILQSLKDRNIRLFISLVYTYPNFDNAAPPDSVPLKNYGMPDALYLIEGSAMDTGGYYAIVDASRIHAGVIDQISREDLNKLYSLMSSFYLLSIDPPKEHLKSKKLRFTVITTKGEKVKGVKVLQSEELLPCDSKN